MITIKELKEVIEYNKDTGDFYWLESKQGRPVDRPAGFVSHQGYTSININGIRYHGPRLAWFYMTGEWPNTLIGYKDNNPRNLAWDNLKLITQEERLDSFKSLGEKLNKQKKEHVGQLVKPVRKARFTNAQVTQAVEEFIKNKTLINGVYV